MTRKSPHEDSVGVPLLKGSAQPEDEPRVPRPGHAALPGLLIDAAGRAVYILRGPQVRTMRIEKLELELEIVIRTLQPEQQKVSHIVERHGLREIEPVPRNRRHPGAQRPACGIEKAQDEAAEAHPGDDEASARSGSHCEDRSVAAVPKAFAHWEIVDVEVGPERFARG